MADRPRTFREVIAAEDPAERERMERAETFKDASIDRDDFRAAATVVEHRGGNGEWRVEYFDEDGTPYVTIFAGQEAERRARDYFGSLKTRRLKIVRAGASSH
jgi:hypothetical protein